MPIGKLSMGIFLKQFLPYIVLRFVTSCNYIHSVPEI